MSSVRTTRGYRLNLQGRPTRELAALPPPPRVAVVPERIPFVKPRLLIEKRAGIHRDAPVRRQTQSPDQVSISRRRTGGRHSFGPRRVIRAIVIACDPDETALDSKFLPNGAWPPYPAKNLATAMCHGGLWSLLRNFPSATFQRRIAQRRPSMSAWEHWNRFSPNRRCICKTTRPLSNWAWRPFKNCPPPGWSSSAPSPTASRPTPLNADVTHAVTGPYPSDDPGRVVVPP